MRSRVGWIVLIAALLSPHQARAQSQILVLEGGTYIDGTGSSPISNAVIVIEGSRIKAVGSKGQVSYPDNARIIRTDGRTMLPGLGRLARSPPGLHAANVSAVWRDDRCGHARSHGVEPRAAGCDQQRQDPGPENVCVRRESGQHS